MSSFQPISADECEDADAVSGAITISTPTSGVCVLGNETVDDSLIVGTGGH